MTQFQNGFQDPDEFVDPYETSGAVLIEGGLNFEANVNGSIVHNSQNGGMRRKVDDQLTQFEDFIPSIAVFRLSQGDQGVVRGSVVFHTTRLLIYRVSEQRQESAQITRTFSPNVDPSNLSVTFFGDKPRIYNIEGTLFYGQTNRDQGSLNTLPANQYGPGPTPSPSLSAATPDDIPDQDWYNSFLYAYENLMKGTECARLGLQIRLSYAYQWREGYMLAFNTLHDVGMPGEVPFNLSMLVLKSGTYRRIDQISSAYPVDSARINLGNTDAESGVLFETPDGDPQFVFDPVI